MDYTHVTGGAVDIGPRPRPTTWRDATNSYTGLRNADDAFLLTLGWYPVVDVKPAFDPATETYETVTQFTINATDVTQTFVVRALTARELADIADAIARQGNKDTAKAHPDNKPVTWGELRPILIDAGLLDT